MKKKIKIILIILFFIFLVKVVETSAAYITVDGDSTPNIGQVANQSYSQLLRYTRSDIGKIVDTVSSGIDFWYREYSSRSMCIHETALNTVDGSYYEFERIVDLDRNSATVYDSTYNGMVYTDTNSSVFYNAYMAFIGYYRRKHRLP